MCFIACLMSKPFASFSWTCELWYLIILVLSYSDYDVEKNQIMILGLQYAKTIYSMLKPYTSRENTDLV